MEKKNPENNANKADIAVMNKEKTRLNIEGKVCGIAEAIGLYQTGGRPSKTNTES